MTSTAELEHGSQVATASEPVIADNGEPLTPEIPSTKVTETVTAGDDASVKETVSKITATPKPILSIAPVEAIRSTSPLLTPFSNAQVNPLGASNAGDKLSTPTTTAANSRGASPLGRKIKRAVVVNIPKIPDDAELPYLTDEEAEEILQDIRAFVENEQIYPHELVSFIEPFDYDINLQTVEQAKDIIVNIPDAADWDEYLSELKELKLAEMNINPAAKTQAHRRRESWVNNAIPADPRVVSYRLQKYLDNQASLVEEPMSPGGGVNGINPPPSAASVAPAPAPASVSRPSHGRTSSVNPLAAPFIPGKKRFAPETEAIPSEHESETDTNPYGEGEVHTNPSEDGHVAVEDRRTAAPRPRLNAGAAEFTPTFGSAVGSSTFNFSVNKPGGTAPYRLVAHEEEPIAYSHHATDSMDRPYGDIDRYKRHRLVESADYGNGKFVPGFPGAPLQPPADFALEPESDPVMETEAEPAVIRPGRDSMATFKFPYGPQPKKVIEIKEPPTPPPSTEKQKPSDPVPIFGSKSSTPSAFNPRAPAFEFSMPSRITQRLMEADDGDDSDDRDHFRNGPPNKKSAHGFDPVNEHLASEIDMDDTLSGFNFPQPPSTFTPGNGQHVAAQLRPTSAAFSAKYLPHNGNRASLGSVFGGPEGFEQDGNIYQQAVRKGSRGAGPLTIPNAYETASASDEFVYPGPEDGEDDDEEEEQEDDDRFDDEDEDDDEDEEDDDVSYEEGHQQVLTASRLSRTIARRVERQVAEQVQDVLDVLASGARDKEEAQLRERELRWKLVERKHQDALSKLQEAVPVQSSPVQAFRANLDQDAFLAKIAEVVKQNATTVDTAAILEGITQQKPQEPASVDAIVAALQDKLPSNRSLANIDHELLSASIVKSLQPHLSSAMPTAPSPIDMEALRTLVIDEMKEQNSKPIDHDAIARAASSAFSSAHLRMQSESEAQMSKTMAQLKANVVDEVLNALQESEKTATQRTGEVLGEVLRAVRSLRSEREKDLKEQIVLLRAERKELVAEVEKLHEESRAAKRGEERANDAIADGEKRLRLLQADLAAEKKDLADVKKNRTTLERVVFELKTKSNGTERELVQLREESKAAKAREENHAKVSAEMDEKIKELGLKNRGLDMELAKTRSAALDAERRVKQAVEERAAIVEREKASREREEVLQERLRGMEERLRRAADAEGLVKAAQLRVQTQEKETAALQKKLDEVLAEASRVAQEIDELRAKATRAASLAEHVDQLKEDLGSVRNRSSELDSLNVQLTKQVQSQLEDIERARAETAKTKEDHVSAQNRVEFLSMKLDNSKTLLKRQESELEGLQRQLAEIKNENAQSASVAKTELDALKQQNESLRGQLGKRSAENDGLRSELSRKESQLEISKQQQEAVRMDLAKKTAAVDKLQETSASVRSLQSEVDILRKQLNSRDEEMTRKERFTNSELDTLRKQLNSKEEEMAQKERDSKAELDSLRKQLKSKDEMLLQKDGALQGEVEMLHKQLESKNEMLLQKDRILQEVSEQNEATMMDLHKSVDEMRARLTAMEEEKAALEAAGTAAAAVAANGISPSEVNGMAYSDNSSFWGYPQQAMYGEYELKQPSAEYGWNQFYPDQEEDEEYADGTRTPTLAQQHQRLWQQQQHQMQSNSGTPSVSSVRPSPAPTPRPMEPIDGDDDEGTWWTAD